MGKTNWETWEELGVFAKGTKPSDFVNGAKVQPGIGPKKVTAIPKNTNNVDNVTIYAPILARDYNIETNYQFLHDHPELAADLASKGYEIKDWKLDIVLVDYQIAIELHGGVHDRQNRGMHVREKGYTNDRLKMMVAQLCGYYTMEIPTQRIGPWLQLLPLFIDKRSKG